MVVIPLYYLYYWYSIKTRF